MALHGDCVAVASVLFHVRRGDERMRKGLPLVGVDRDTVER